MIDTALINEELTKYFRELSPRDRRLMFEHIEGLSDEASDLCRKLYKARYTDPKDPEHVVDNWLWKMVYLPGLYSKKFFFRAGIKSEADRTVKDLMLEDTSAYSDLEKTILYLEFRNVAKRYLSTCGNDNYASKMLGLRKAGPEEKKIKAAEDIWGASRGFAAAAKEEERLEIWCAALRDELFQYDEISKEYYEALERGTKKKK